MNTDNNNDIDVNDLNEINNNVDNSNEDFTPTVTNYTCENCGGGLIYSPSDKGLLCKSCNQVTKIDIGEFKTLEHDFLEALEKGSEIDINENSNLDEVSCTNCGAVLVFESGIYSGKCLYCGSELVKTQEPTKYIKPEYMIPFEFSRNEADRTVSSWCTKKFYMNSSFKKNIKASKLTGVYVPYWTYDANTTTSYSAMRGKHYYVTRYRVVNGRRQPYREMRTKWQPVSGTYKNFFDDTLIPATVDTTDNKYSDVLFFNLQEVVPYNEKYISGFIARKYDIDLSDGWDKSKAYLSPRINAGIQSQVGGDVIKNLSKETMYTDITFKHILLPIWIYTYNYKGKPYTFMINGQTGVVTAKYPLDVLRIILTVIFIFFIYYIMLSFT